MSNSFGMPKIQIEFYSRGLSAIRRSGRGIALLILKEAEAKNKSLLLRNQADLEELGLSPENQRIIKLAFEGRPYKLKVELYDDTKRSLSKLLKEIELDKFNYYAAPYATKEEQKTILSWQAESPKRHRVRKTSVFIAYDEAEDSKLVVNWAVPWVVYEGEKYEGAEFTAIIATVLAGLDLQRSCTYYDFKGKIDDAALPFVDNEDQAVNDGKLFLTFDGDRYKIARGVNSLVTHTAKVGEDQSKIRVVEGINLITSDVGETWDQEYVGKILNTYNNKQQFIALINRVYFPTLFGELLDGAGNNRVDIDMAANERYAITRGANVDEMTEMQIRTYNTGSNVYLSGRVSMLDAMEDLFLEFWLD